MPAPSIADIVAQFSYADAKETGTFTLEMFVSGQKLLTAPPTVIDPETGIKSINARDLGPKIEADDIDFTNAFAMFADETKDRYPGASWFWAGGVSDQEHRLASASGPGGRRDYAVHVLGS